MKNYLLNFLCFLGYTALCSAQVDTLKYSNIFFNKINNEIYKNEVFTDKAFSDTVTFILKNKTIQAVNKQTKRENWDDIKKVFKGTDYVVNLISTEKYKNTIKVEGLQYYRLNNHVDGYLIGVNEQGCISVIQQEIRDWPPDAPKNKGHHH